ncbi:transcriptional regulator [Granulicella arctica]|uniref:Transcriptional regulator n=2 Tax=Granulicella arctica TaxID=940613 RepID=A0A7Y9PFI1_9BACT|nr:transcriptional regulator [Granulicella arctica]
MKFTTIADSSTLADFLLEIKFAHFKEQCPGGFPTDLLDLPPKESSKTPVAFQKEAYHYSCWKSKGRFAMKEKPDVLQGTLALMVLKTLDVLGTQHGWGIARRIEQISGDLLAVNQGTLYPLLLKLEHEGSIASEWGASENNRRARFYRLTGAGRKQLQAETRDWEQTAAIIARFFKVKAEDLP